MDSEHENIHDSPTFDPYVSSYRDNEFGADFKDTIDETPKNLRYAPSVYPSQTRQELYGENEESQNKENIDLGRNRNNHGNSNNGGLNNNGGTNAAGTSTAAHSGSVNANKINAHHHHNASHDYNSSELQFPVTQLAQLETPKRTIQNYTPTDMEFNFQYNAQMENQQFMGKSKMPKLTSSFSNNSISSLDSVPEISVSNSSLSVTSPSYSNILTPIRAHNRGASLTHFTPVNSNANNSQMKRKRSSTYNNGNTSASASNPRLAHKSSMDKGLLMNHGNSNGNLKMNLNLNLSMNSDGVNPFYPQSLTSPTKSLNSPLATPLKSPSSGIDQFNFDFASLEHSNDTGNNYSNGPPFKIDFGSESHDMSNVTITEEQNEHTQQNPYHYQPQGHQHQHQQSSSMEMFDNINMPDSTYNSAPATSHSTAPTTANHDSGNNDLFLKAADLTLRMISESKPQVNYSMESINPTMVAPEYERIHQEQMVENQVEHTNVGLTYSNTMQNLSYLNNSNNDNSLVEIPHAQGMPSLKNSKSESAITYLSNDYFPQSDFVGGSFVHPQDRRQQIPQSQSHAQPPQSSQHMQQQQHHPAYMGYPHTMDVKTLHFNEQMANGAVLPNNGNDNKELENFAVPVSMVPENLLPEGLDKTKLNWKKSKRGRKSLSDMNIDPSNVEKKNKKTHECPLCKAKFQRPEHVKRHMRSHSDEKPYKCDQPDCGKKFNRNDNLKAHLRKIHKLKL